MKTVSASALERAAKCPGSFSLEQVQEESGYSARKGSAFHRWAEDVVKVNHWLLAPRNDLHKRCSKHVANAILQYTAFAKQVLTEVSFGIKVFPWYVEMHVGKDRNYKSGFDFVGTLDLLVVDGDGNVTIIDYKTGRKTTPAEYNYQIAFAVAAASSVFNPDSIDAGLMYIDEDGKIETDIKTCYDQELARGKILKVHEGLQDTPNKLYAGEHCAWCPAYHNCDYHMSFARTLLGQERIAVTDIVPLEKLIRKLQTTVKIAKAWGRNTQNNQGNTPENNTENIAGEGT